MGTAVLESAASWWAGWVRYLSFHHCESARFGNSGRQRLQERSSIGVFRCAEQFGRRSDLDELARIHDADPVACLGYNAEIVRNE